jgi:hypothetical protein
LRALRDRDAGPGRVCLPQGAWPGLNPRLRGFGGEEGYLQEKFRQRGGRVLCHPQLGWLHRFPRPAGVSYPNIWEDRVRNYYIAWSEIGWDLAPVRSHFRELLGSGQEADGLLERARQQAEHPMNVFDGVFCLADEADGAHAHPPEISWRIEHQVPGQGLGPEHRRLAGWREAVVAAERRCYRHLLLLDACTPSDRVNVPPLSEPEWGLCLLSAADDGDGEEILALGPASTGVLPALPVAVPERAYKQLLADLPADQAGRTGFLAAWGSVDGYLAQKAADGTFTVVAACPPAPEADRPERAPDLEVLELVAGLTVRQPESLRVHQLNNTASVVFELCDGRLTVAGIAAEVARTFALDAAPLAEVAACVAGLQQAGVLARRVPDPAAIRVVNVASPMRQPKAGDHERPC